MADRFKDWTPPVIIHGEMTRWFWVVWHPENLTLGKYTDIGAFCYLNALHGIEIGEGVELGSHCSVYSVSTIDNKKGRVTIGKDAKIGSHSIIMPGVTIGESAIIGAHSFVNKDVPAYKMAYGTPIKIREA